MYFLPWLLIVVALLAIQYVNAYIARQSGRKMSPLILAVVLNTAALVVPLMRYAAVLLTPLTCFGIAVSVAMVSCRRAWLSGTMACPWFFSPYVVWWAITASPDQVAAYGRIPWDYLGFVVGCGGIGALMVCVARWFRDLRHLYGPASNELLARTDGMR